MIDHPAVICEAADGIVTLRLNRPAKLNAINPSMLDALEAAVDRIDSDGSCRVVILTGSGDRAFSAGADLVEIARLEPIDMWRIWTRRGHRLFDRLAGLRQPVIAAVNGLAYGGGLELVMACDLRLAAVHATFALPEVKIATVPGWGGTNRLAAQIGFVRARQVLLTGEPITARTAAHWGLINECLAASDLESKTRRLARAIASNSPVAVQAAKLAMAGGGGSFVEAMADVVCAQERDAAEGMAAFREGRAPNYHGPASWSARE